MLLRRKRSTSKVVLERLPAKFENGLVDYNNKVHDVFDLYLRTVAHVYDTLGEDVTLPLSSTKLISSEDYQVNSPAVTLDDKLQSVAQPYKACSAFAALSGNTDDRLYDSQDLISNIRYQVYANNFFYVTYCRNLECIQSLKSFFVIVKRARFYYIMVRFIKIAIN
jgi:hypothetical protein